jgi:hypothetical protein
MSHRQWRTHRRYGPSEHGCFDDLPGRFDRSLDNRRWRGSRRWLRRFGLVRGVVILSRELLLAFRFGGSPARGFLHRGFPAQAAAHQQSLIVFQ